MSTPVLVTPLVAEHAAAYRALMLQAYAQDADAFTSTAEERAGEPLDWWVRRIADPSGLSRSFGAWGGDQLLGSATVEFNRRAKTCHKALIIGMYVTPAARGRGLGAQLLQAALAHARARPGVRQATLTCTEGNRAAQALYEAAGFRVFGVEPQGIQTPAGDFGKLHMWAPLRGAEPVVR